MAPLELTETERQLLLGTSHKVVKAAQLIKDESLASYSSFAGINIPSVAASPESNRHSSSQKEVMAMFNIPAAGHHNGDLNEEISALE